MAKAHDFDWLETHLGTAVPKTLKDAYLSGEVRELEDIIVDESDPELYLCITEFQRQDEQGYQSTLTGTEGTLLLGYDGSGSVYFARPQEKFKHVYFYDHETEEPWRVGLSVPGFIKKLREYKTAVDEPPATDEDELIGKWKAVNSDTDDLDSILDFIPLHYTFNADGTCIREYKDPASNSTVPWHIKGRSKGRLSVVINDLSPILIEILGDGSFSETNKDGDFQVTYQSV
jgi:hypothetical protein